MNKKFINGFLLASLVVGMGGFLSSCQDYDDDINQLREEVAANKSAIDDIKGKIANGAILTSVTPNGAGLTVTVEKNGQTQTFDIKNGKDGANGKDGVNGTNGTDGKDGKDAVVWTIEQTANGYFWAKDGELTDLPAQGPKGDKGDKGDQGDKGDTGATGPQGPQGNDGAPGTSAAGIKGDKGADGLNGAYWQPNETGTELIKYVYDTTKKEYVVDATAKPVKIAIQGAITATLSSNYLYINGLEGEDGPVIIARNGNLTSMVFVPQVYADGVECARFTYVNGQYQVPVTMTKDESWNGFVLSKNSVWSYDWAWKDKDKNDPDDYEFGGTGEAVFHLNPDNANLDGVEFNFLPIQNVKVISRAAGDKEELPSLTVIGDPVQEKGDLTVKYQINNARKLNYKTDKRNSLPMTALAATIPANKSGNGDNATEVASTVITSDYIGVLRSQGWFNAFYIEPTSPATDPIYVPTYGKSALNSSAKVSVPYFKTLSLPDTLVVGYSATDYDVEKPLPGEYVNMEYISFKEAYENWGLTAKYTMVDYKVGQSQTEDSKFAKVDAEGNVTFYYLDSAGNWKQCTEDDAASRSAIGRHPLVCVTLCKGDKVVLVGYVKIQIEASTPSIVGNEPIVLAEGTFPYVCDAPDPANNPKVESTWETMASKVLAELGLSKQEFTTNFRWDGRTYVYDEDAEDYVSTYDYGNLGYSADTGTGTTSGFLTWTYSQANAFNILDDYENGTVTLYSKFSNLNVTNEYLYLGVTVKILGKPSIKFATLNPNMLYGDTNNEVGMRVPQINNSADKGVGDFYAYVKEYYTGNEISAVYDGTTGYPAINKLGGLNVSYTFAPATAQMSKMKPSSDKMQLLDDKDNLIASIDADGKVTYAQTDAAKKLLNAGTRNAWAMVELSATYGSCGLKFDKTGDNQVRIDFLRPVDVNSLATPYAVYPNGTDPVMVALGDIFTMTDSYNNKLFVKSNKTFTDPNKLFEYFNVTEISVDFTGIESSGVEFEVRQYDGGPTVVKSGKKYTITGSPLTTANLATNLVVDYSNAVLEKPFVVEIPVTVTYFWGTETTKVKVTINAKPK